MKEPNGKTKQKDIYDDFFNNSTTTPTSKKSHKKDDTNRHSIEENKQGTGDEFFDDPEPQTKEKKKISINDFNF